ncbi:MAG: AmmeMemoRadiSam system protein B [Anaerolineae bacterium]|jgi:AmmeMemoRadiSam system protein B|nr:AmmeMemoRadiSam system protein B [Anaerolineae bacterium]
MRPKLRPIQPQWGQQDGRPVLVLRDPLALSGKVLAVPQPLAPLLALCDGTRDESALRAALEIRAGVRLSPDVLASILQQLDDALLLENERSAEALRAALDAYRSAPFRAPASAGGGYPDDVAALSRMLQGYLDAAGDVRRFPNARGLVSPHIDYMRGGGVYGGVWAAAADAVRQAEVAVIFGTDHMGDFSPFTLTRQHYATPFGVLPTDRDIVDTVAAAIGEDWAFRDEIHHRNEHSVELAAVWLHYVRGGRPCAVVPVLSGSFERFVCGQETARDDAVIAQGISALRRALEGRRSVVIAAVDLAHTGPAFGDTVPAGLVQRAMGKKADQALMERMCEGDADGFLALIREEGDRRHICGLPPIYLALRLLEPARGHAVAYDHAPADAQGTSFVSFCGIVWE